MLALAGGKGNSTVLGRLLSSLGMNAAQLELLERTELPSAQARAILQVMESELALHQGTLATRAELQAGLHGLELKLEALRGETNTGLQALRAELIGKIRGTVRWNFVFWVTQLAAVATILKLLK
jgi:hypothetical protein